jgi:hypothetical protein
VNLRPEDVPRIEIQQRSALVSRHLPLSFGEKLPIQHVIRNGAVSGHFADIA